MYPHTSVLNLLRGAPRSLSDLQQQALVSLPTLRKAVQELTDGRWIRIVGQAGANGGRPPNVFGLDDRYYTLIGVHLQLPGMHLITADILGGVIHEQRVIHPHLPQPDDVLAAISEYAEKVVAMFPERRFQGIAIAAPGFVDPESGDILEIGRVPGWNNFPICNRLQTQLGLPTWIANDIDCMAFAEFQRTGTSTLKNLVYVGFDEGVKASLFLNNELYKGSLGNAGLIAGDLLRVKSDGNPVEQRDVLSIHGVNEVFARRLEALPFSDAARYEQIESMDDPRRRFEAILAHANASWPLCQGVVELMIETLAAAAANLILILQPDMLTFGGVLSVLPTQLVAALEARTRAHLPQIVSNKVNVKLGSVTTPSSAAVGAVQFVLETQIFERPDLAMNAPTPRA